MMRIVQFDRLAWCAAVSSKLWTVVLVFFSLSFFLFRWAYSASIWPVLRPMNSLIKFINCIAFWSLSHIYTIEPDLDNFLNHSILQLQLLLSLYFNHIVLCVSSWRRSLTEFYWTISYFRKHFNKILLLDYYSMNISSLLFLSDLFSIKEKLYQCTRPFLFNDEREAKKFNFLKLFTIFDYLANICKCIKPY